MGIAAYNRGSKRIADEATRKIEASRATNELRVALWRDVLDMGVIMTFRGAQGAVLTVGPNKTAMPCRDRFACYREEGDPKWREALFFANSLSAAWWIVDHVGRARPIKVVSYA